MAAMQRPTMASIASIVRTTQRISTFTPISLLMSTKSPSWSISSLASATISIPAISINIPGLISDIWDGLLKAVPKKKTSHMKKRHRQLAGKALKDVNAVNSCPGCGKPKKAHTLCPYCVAEIKQSWKQAAKQAATKAEEAAAT